MPVAAVLLAARVKLLEVVLLAGLNAAVTPLGNPEAEKLTAPVKPFRGPTVIVLVPPLPPCRIVKLVGETERPKSGGTATVRLTVVVWDSVPDVPVDVPVIVTVEAPVTAPLLAVSVNTLEVPLLVGLNAAVTPIGKPEAEKLTAPVNPFRGATEIVLVPPLPPCRIVRLAGEADRLKSGGLATVRPTVVVCAVAPEVPVMVTV